MRLHCLRWITKLLFTRCRRRRNDGVTVIHVILVIVCVLSATLSLHVLLTSYLPQLFRRRLYDPRTDGGIHFRSNEAVADDCGCGHDRPCSSICSSVQDNKTWIWPSANNNDSMRRLSDQIRFTEIYGEWYNARRSTSENSIEVNDKVILRVGKTNFYDWIDGRTRFIKDQCPVTDCLMTSDVANYRETADVLIISEMKSASLRQFQPKPRDQIWIAQHMEPPPQNLIDVDLMGDLINWTASYRRDSTVPFPYYVIEPRNAPPDDEQVNYALNRTKQVAWVVSSSRDHNSRKGYVRELSKYIAVDVYGDGGWLQCDRKGDDCWTQIKKQYKFYLAFENSNCWDYVTEKLFRNAFSNDLLPVVMGARKLDYLDIAPPHSFIHVDDFRSPRELADYLHVLDANDTLYNEYFRWKSSWTVTTDTKYWCRMCALLHAATDQDFQPQYVHWYPDYGTYWNGVCHAHWQMEKGARWKTWNNVDT